MAAQDPDRLFSMLCRHDRVNYDPRLRDMIAAVVHVARGGPVKPWWEFTRERESFLRRLEAEMTRLRGPRRRTLKPQILK